MKPSAVIVVKHDGTADTVFTGDVAEARVQFRSIKKGQPIPGAQEVICLSARGNEGRWKWKNNQPISEPEPESKPRRGRPPKFPE